MQKFTEKNLLLGEREVASDFFLLLWDKPCKIIWDKPCKFCRIKPCKKVITPELPPVQKEKRSHSPHCYWFLPPPNKDSSKDK